MFRTIFSRYIAATTLIVIVSFGILTTVISAVIGDYAKNEREKDVEHMGALASEIVLHEYPLDGSVTLAEWTTAHAGLKQSLEAIVKADDGTTLFVADKNSRILICAAGSLESARRIIGNESYWGGVRAQLVSGMHYHTEERVPVLGSDNYYVYAKPLFNGQGEYIGCVYATVSVASAEKVTSTAMYTVIMSSLWIMLAMLIAFYFITERQVDPIRRMSRVAQRYAKGDFGDRVEPVGSVEITELAESINHMADELEGLEQKRNRFISDVSHELRSPMTSMLGFVEAVSDGSCPPEKRSYYLSLVAEEIKRLSRLVGNLLDVSRLEMGEKKMNFIKYDLADNAATILFSLEARINEKKLDVSFDVEEDIYVRADADSMYRVLYNLIENAVKFSCTEGKLAVSIRRNGKGAHLEVYNEGAGISKEDLPYVFERFYKSDKSRGIDKKGVGLGLYFVKTILTAHGGEIRAESEEGKDCRFIVEMPVYQENA